MSPTIHFSFQIAQVAWVNTTVFDYKGQLRTGKLTLYTWPIESELEESVHYMGSTVLNPSTTECASLDIEVMAPNFRPIPPNMRPGAPIMYPSMERIHSLAEEISTVAATVVSSRHICLSICLSVCLSVRMHMHREATLLL